MTENSTISEIHLEIEIDAPPAEVWKALTSNIGDWWPAEFYAGGKPESRSFQLEASVGGHMKEVWKDGGGVLWGTVVTVDPNARLQILGSLFPNWGGPALLFGTWSVATAGNKSTLTYSEHSVGHASQAGIEDKTKGWNFLLEALKSHVQGDPAPVWSH